MTNQITTQNLNDNIVAGGGYSTDSQQITPEACYNATSSAGEGSHSVVQLTEAIFFSDLQSQIGVDITAKGKFGMFSAGASVDYMRSMEDKDYSLSLNYYSYMYNTVSVQLAGAGMQALTATGQSFYNNEKAYPYFGLTCGDKYISSYEQGAMLIMGININFNSNYDKEQFTAKAGGSFGNIFSATSDVSSIASSLNIQFSLSIQATQAGGDPSQLAKILSKNSNGEYYALTCSQQNMNDCTEAANGLLNYAVTDFTTQVSFVNNIGLTPLGQAFTVSKPIIYEGLTPPPSLVNETVIADRMLLAESLIENQYYEQKFDELLNGYPVAWDTTSALYQTSQNLYQQAQNNINVLMSPGNPDNGALGCYDYPDQCDSLTQSIQASLQPITQSDLNYLSAIQYAMPGPDCTFYFNGEGYIAGPPIFVCFYNVAFVTLNDTYFSTEIHYERQFSNGQCMGGVDNMVTVCNTFTSTDGLTYKGTSYSGPGGGNNCENFDGNFVLKKTPTSFYFQAYNGSNTDSAELLGNDHENIADFA